MKARLLVLLAAVAILAIGSPSWAQTYWVGTNSTSYGDPGNWNGPIPSASGQPLVVNVTSPYILTITSTDTSVVSGQDIWAGTTAGQTGSNDLGGFGQINQTGGYVSSGNGNWVQIGDNGATGTYNLADTTGAGGAFTGYGMGSGSLTAQGGGILSIGGNFWWDGSTYGGTGTFNMNTSGVLTANWIRLAGNGGTGVFNLDNGTVISNGDFKLGDGMHNTTASSGTLNISGGSISNAGTVQVASGGGCLGTVNQTGGVFTSTGAFFSIGASGSGSYTISGGTLNALASQGWGNFNIGDNGGSNSSGTLTVNSAVVNFTNGMQIGKSAGSQGIVNLSSGVISGNWVHVGNSGTGTLNVSGGSFNSSDETDVGENSNSSGTLGVSGGVYNGKSMNVGNGGSGVVNLSSGIINLTSDLNVGNGGNGSAGTLNVSNGAINVSGGLYLATPSAWSSNSTTGAMNLTGGTVTANYVRFGGSSGWSLTGIGSGTVGVGAVLNSKGSVELAYCGTSGASGDLTVDGVLNVNTAGSGGNLSIGVFDSINGNLTIDSGATVKLQNNASLIFNVNGNNGTHIVNQNGGLVATYSDSGSTVGGTGILNMCSSWGGGGSYTYNLNGGTLQVSGVGGVWPGNGTRVFNFSGGTLKATGNNDNFYGQTWGDNGITDTELQGVGAIIDDSGYSIGVGHQLNGPGALTKIGNGQLTLYRGNNTYQGGTTVNGGTLAIVADGSLGNASGALTFASNSRLVFLNNNIVLNASRNIAINGGATATIDTNGNLFETIAGVIADGTGGPGSLATAGVGTLTLTGPSTYTGATTVNVGTLLLNASGGNQGALGATAVNIGPAGTLAGLGTPTIGGPVTTTGAGAQINLQNGSIDTLSIAGNLNLAASSVLSFDLGTSNGSNDQIAVAGLTSLAGTNTVNLAAIGALNAGTYTVLTSAAGGIAAADFSVGTHPAIRGNFALNSSAGTALVVNVMANATPAVAYWSGAIAGNFNWNGGAGNNTNWATDATGATDTQQIPGVITNVYFTANNAVPSSGSTLTTQLDLNYSINSLTFAVSGASGITAAVVNPGAYTLTMGTGGLLLDVSSTASATIGAGSILLNGSQNWANNASLPLVVNANIKPTNASGLTTLTINGTGTGGVTLGGAISDQGPLYPLALVFNQAGVTQLNGSNSFTGGVTISSGTVQLGNVGALNASSPNAVTFGSGSFLTGDLRLNGNSVTVSALNANDGTVMATVENGAATPVTLTVNTSANNTYNGVLQDGGAGSLALTKAGTAGTLYLTGYSNTYTGATNVNGGILNFGAGALPLVSSNIHFHGGTLQWATANSQDISALIAPIDAGQTAILDTNGNYVWFSTALTGSGGLTKTGNGSLTLLTANTYTGVTTVNGGSLQVDNGGSTATLGTGNVVLGNNGALVYDRSDNYTLVNSISGGGGLYQTGNGTLTVALNPSVGYVTLGPKWGDSVVMNLGPGNSLTTTGEIWVSAAGGASAVMNVNGGTLTSGSWLAIGRGGDGGVLNVTSGSVAVLNNNLTIGSLTGNAGTLNVSGGTVHSNGSIYVGESGTGTMTVSGSSVVIAGNGIDVGRNSGAIGTLTIGGNAVFNSTQGWPGSVVGDSSGATGTVVQSGSSVVNITAPWFSVGESGIGSYTLNGGTLNVTPGTYWNFNVGNNDGSSGTLTVNGGVVNVNGGHGLSLGNGTSSAQGVVVMTAGTVNTGFINVGAGGQGSFVMSNGVINADWMDAGGNNGWPNFVGGVGTIEIDGGVVNLTGNLKAADGGGVRASSGTVTINNGAQVTVGAFGATTGTGLFNLNSGTLSTGGFAIDGSGSATVYFGGGLLRSTGDWTFGGGLGCTGVIGTSGAIIDTNGHNDTISATLIPDPTLLTTDGGVIKRGAGTLHLHGTNTYAGGTVVNGGMLQINSDAALGAAPNNEQVNLTLNNGSQLFNDGSAMTLNGNRDIRLGSGTQYMEGGWGGLTINGQITGPGNLAVAWDGPLVLNNANTYQGSTTIGTTAGSNYWNDGGNHWAQTSVKLGSNNALPAGTDMYFGDNHDNTATLDLNGFNATVGALSGGTNAYVTNSASGGTSTLTVGADGALSTFAGTINNGAGQVALDVVGGSLTLSGSNSYSAGTVVSGGELILTSASAIEDGTSLTVGDPTAFAAPIVASAVAAAPVMPVPEPGTLGLLAAGAVAALVAAARRRRP